ncbi:DUF1275 family protein [Kitasatospora sp. NPDC091335]|uniref:YoaK family protein n=1 Tax=Kitasatospora sp. NPDC091335 TaxID=3364085 RepID=UPI003815E7A5
MTTPAAESRTAPPPPVPGPKIHDRHPLALALFGLTLVSGLIDAVSYLGLGHVFTANMTGNVVVIAFALAGAPGFSVTGSLTSLVAFLLGALLAGRLATRHAGTRRPAQLRTVFVLEAALYGAAAVVVFAWSADGPAQYAVIALLALAMGIRNGTVRGLGVPDLTTTVLTLTLTGLAADSRLAGGTAPVSAGRSSPSPPCSPVPPRAPSSCCTGRPPGPWSPAPPWPAAPSCSTASDRRSVTACRSRSVATSGRSSGGSGRLGKAPRSAGPRRIRDGPARVPRATVTPADSRGHRDFESPWPMSGAQFEALAAKVSGKDLKGFFDAWAHGTVIPPKEYLYPGTLAPPAGG